MKLISPASSFFMTNTTAGLVPTIAAVSTIRFLAIFLFGSAIPAKVCVHTCSKSRRLNSCISFEMVSNLPAISCSWVQLSGLSNTVLAIVFISETTWGIIWLHGIPFGTSCFGHSSRVGCG